jgi:hypothetical protein
MLNMNNSNITAVGAFLIFVSFLTAALTANSNHFLFCTGAPMFIGLILVLRGLLWKT